MKALLGYHIEASDGDLGHVYDFYFDDQSWKVLYVVVDTGTFLSGRRVLLAASGLEHPNWANKTFPVNHTKEQIRNSPSISEEKPVSRQEQEALHNYFAWVPYWGPYGAMAQPVVAPVDAPNEAKPEQTREGDPHLRSLREVLNYRIHAEDGEIGHCDDFILNDDEWHMEMFVVDTRNWLPGRHVLLATEWIHRIVWNEESLEVDLPRETIKNSPEYDPREPINEEMRGKVYDYYGRPAERYD
jgi:uncharacterized protein YrrD